MLQAGTTCSGSLLVALAGRRAGGHLFAIVCLSVRRHGCSVAHRRHVRVPSIAHHLSTSSLPPPPPPPHYFVQLLVIPTVMAIEFATSGKTTPLHEKLCLVVLLLGVGISTVTDVALTRVRMRGRVRVCWGDKCASTGVVCCNLSETPRAASLVPYPRVPHENRWMGARALCPSSRVSVFGTLSSM